ncbi:hypothetical protein [Shewanella sp.]|uniref:hypothetical protein n=1 Tax=Shewanella sp. TaxID=50422 RepID=UPI003561B552
MSCCGACGGQAEPSKSVNKRESVLENRPGQSSVQQTQASENMASVQTVKEIPAGDGVQSYRP